MLVFSDKTNRGTHMPSPLRGLEQELYFYLPERDKGNCSTLVLLNQTAMLVTLDSRLGRCRMCADTKPESPEDLLFPVRRLSEDRAGPVLLLAKGCRISAWQDHICKAGWEVRRCLVIPISVHLDPAVSLRAARGAAFESSWLGLGTISSVQANGLSGHPASRAGAQALLRTVLSQLPRQGTQDS